MEPSGASRVEAERWRAWAKDVGDAERVVLERGLAMLKEWREANDFTADVPPEAWARACEGLDLDDAALLNELVIAMTPD